MLKPIPIKDDLFYIGVNDRTKHLFENLWPLPKGVSYNSYLIVDEKTALFDTVDVCYSDQFFHKLEIALDGRLLDYVIINHMEPDHSGSLGLLRSRFPNVQVVGNKRTADMVQGFFGITDGVMVIDDLDELSLGKHNLVFHLTPMVHWPETMMTYDTTYKIVFSGDAFGTFGTLDGGITDAQLHPERYYDEMIRYYSNVVGKFGSPVQKALEKLATLDIKYICSTHGPVWTLDDQIKKVIGIYDKLSRYEGDEGVVIAYGSMYGHTEQMAETIAYELAQQGIREVILHNVSKRSHSYIIRDIFKYKGLIVGSPTYNNKLFPEVEYLLSKIEGRDMKNRYFGYFGSFTWAGAAVKRLAQFAIDTKFEVVGEPVEMRQAMRLDTYDACISLGKAMADRLKQDR
ncbi:anaerobic nitric oxide reductase flavorubredoxin [Dysgonomonas sp. PFB1-18]|uniref:FprA family A-type flavoprotein n=1 Tax=unclassified Dysgonomonas TaxID=2630389 RepID=UPI0024745C70|nr:MULTISPECIES: FprA family A-type flavoprotein [unclassified Dysgonomonas]MDH6307566.1 anaerobic nitric oxide reductase flavorubredoxin [Dysgonomonas sp. PF1-14]MDH6337484.1 anaerobic nitric oxide reductase flavorubredoxin [Dysgonomonas sp. PF1-16]MDH6378709.1 anaerobic nitric oxide reductase flavorubredoxin [Dysgonomonas sp. PFB1-18]MDH6399127.1 anaerobic nitric oxide reductase flavorubredoxin [Dysgonomonas sp. PF1-23]